MSFTSDQFSAAFTSILLVFGTIYTLVLTNKLGFGRAVEGILSRVNIEGQCFMLQVQLK